MQAKLSRKRRTRRPSLVKLRKEHGRAALSAFCQQHDSTARLAFAQEAQVWVKQGQDSEDELDAIQHYLQALSIDPMASDALTGIAILGNYNDEEVISLLDLAIESAQMEPINSKALALAKKHQADRLGLAAESDVDLLDCTAASTIKNAQKTAKSEAPISLPTGTSTTKTLLSAALNPDLPADVVAQYQAIEAQLAQYQLSGNAVLTVSGLDGFFAALVSSPNLLSGEQWMPLVFGDGEHAPAWSSTEEFMAFFDQMVIILNRVADIYQENPNAYRPLWLNDASHSNAKAQAVYDWCRAYLKVASLWSMSDDSAVVFEALASIKQYADYRYLDQMGQMDAKAQMQVEKDILAAGLLIYTEFEESRNIELAQFDKNQQKQPIRKENTVKRNDPCPCGSGKKYKKCCL